MKNQWIFCKDQMPKEYQEYFICFKCYDDAYEYCKNYEDDFLTLEDGQKIYMGCANSATCEECKKDDGAFFYYYDVALYTDSGFECENDVLAWMPIPEIDEISNECKKG